MLTGKITGALETFWGLALANLVDYLEGRELTSKVDYTGSDLRAEFTIDREVGPVWTSLLDSEQVTAWFGFPIEIEPEVGGRYAMGGLADNPDPARILDLVPEKRHLDRLGRRRGLHLGAGRLGREHPADAGAERLRRQSAAVRGLGRLPERRRQSAPLPRAARPADLGLRSAGTRARTRPDPRPPPVARPDSAPPLDYRPVTPYCRVTPGQSAPFERGRR